MSVYKRNQRVLLKSFISRKGPFDSVYVCANCGYPTNADFWCTQCEAVMCEQCSESNLCDTCLDKERERLLEMAEYDGDTIG